MSFGILLSFGNVIESVNGVLNWIDQHLYDINGVFSDVDFSVLYTWLPADVRQACAMVLIFFIFLALIGLLRKLSFFFG